MADVNPTKTEGELAEKRGPGRPLGSVNKVKIADETLDAGARTAVQLAWSITRMVARLFGGRMDPRELSDGELEDGVRFARSLVARVSFLAIALMILGFPVWLVETAIAHFKRNEKPELKVVADEQQQTEGGNQ